MVKINISKQSNYPISGVVVRKFLQDFFTKHGIVSDAEATVSFVGKAKMLTLAKKYYKDTRLHGASGIAPHNVFSFVESEVKGFLHITDTLQLGEIVVCFPVVVEEAKKENKLIEQKVLELVEHSALHLLGIHHEE